MMRDHGRRPRQPHARRPHPLPPASQRAEVGTAAEAGAQREQVLALGRLGET